MYIYYASLFHQCLLSIYDRWMQSALLLQQGHANTPEINTEGSITLFQIWVEQFMQILKCFVLAYISTVDDLSDMTIK